MADADRQADESEGHAEVDELDLDLEVIERAVLNDSEEGRAIQSGFVADFGAFITEVVRPILVDVAAEGGQPQLLVNGLAELMRSVADTIEFPLDHPRSGFPPQLGGDGAAAPG